MAEAARRASPLTYVRSGIPPFLILHGRRDLLVPYEQSELLYEAIGRQDGTVTLVTLPDGEHGAWREFLTEPAVRRGAHALASRAGRGDERASPISPAWDLIADFCTAAFAAEGRPDRSGRSGWSGRT